MKANELRIGNYIFISILQEDGGFKNELFTVNATVIRDAEHYGNEWNAEPIPLTEEWLLKFGFTKMKDSIIYSYEYISIEIHRTNGLCFSYDTFIVIFQFHRINPVLQYVHQLQNLYFALTGEELGLTDKK